MMRTLFALLLTLWAISLCFVVPVRAHLWTAADGTKIDARWIMKNPKTRYCCGPQDCMPVTGRVVYTPQGWRVRGWKGYLKVDSADVRKSPDGRPWACYRPSNPYLGESGGKYIRCLWLPGGGQ